MYKKTIWHVVLAAYVVFIFSNSLTPADLSSEESGFVMRLVHQAIGAAGLSAPWLTEHVIRKCAHFSEYTLLGILLFQSMRNLDCGAAFRRQLHMLLIFFIPFVDETLQLFTEGRSRSDQRCMAGYERSRDRYNSLCLYLFPDIRES